MDFGAETPGYTPTSHDVSRRGTARAPLRAAIVGAGLMGRWHARAVAHAGHVVSVIVDQDDARAALLARAHRGASTARSLDMLADIDVVHICTPLPTHMPLMRHAISQRIHVIGEKPLAPTLAETVEILALADAAGVLVIPVHQFIFQRGVLEARDRLRDIGPLLHVDFTTCTAGAEGRSAAGRDDVALEVLPHPLSLVARLVSTDLSRAEWSVRRPQAGELRAATVLDGTSVNITISTGGRPTTNQLRLIGAHGTIAADLFHGFSITQRGAVSRGRKIAQPLLSSAELFVAATGNLARRAVQAEAAYPGLRTMVREFYDAVSRGGPAPISPAETREVASAQEQIRASFFA